MSTKQFIRTYRAELEAAINGAIYRHDGNGGAGRIPDPAPTYSKSEIAQWIANDEGLYEWAQRMGVKV